MTDLVREVWKNRNYSNKCDVYSFAILAFVIITEKIFPYGNEMNQQLVSKRVAESSNFRPKIEEKFFKKCKFLIPLIKRNWQENPMKRNSFEEIVEEITSNIDKNKNLLKQEKENRNSISFKKENDALKKRIIQLRDPLEKELDKNFLKNENNELKEKIFQLERIEGKDLIVKEKRIYVLLEKKNVF